MNNRYPGEVYLTGGNNPPAQGVVPPGPRVAKVDATTGKEIWRTVLENGNVSGSWVGAANLNILPDGKIPIAFGNHLVKLDGDTGRILQDARTSKLLAESDFLDPMNFNTLLSPGFGGRFYYMWDKGFIVLQPMPQRDG